MTTLARGKKVAVVAPGGTVLPGKLEAGLDFLRSMGFEPILGMHVYDKHRYLAGTRRDRFLDLEWALTAPDIRAVWFARGGYGTAQLIDSIPWDRVVRYRPIIGFSDATALLLALSQHGIESIHGPVLTSFATESLPLDQASRQVITDLLLFDRATFLPGIPLCAPYEVVEGPVIGGNLAVLCSLAGTRHALRACGKIVVLEDVGESPYRIDRLLSQLIDSGSLDGVRGIALGEFLRCNPTEESGYLLADVFRELLEPLNVPILHQLPIGHGSRNFAFPYNRAGKMTISGIQLNLVS